MSQFVVGNPLEVSPVNEETGLVFIQRGDAKPFSLENL